MSTEPVDYGVIIGRFQVDDLNNQPGYVALLQEVQKRCKNVLIILGEAPVVSKRNPLSFEHRRAMFTEYNFADVVKLNDEEYDEDWNNNLNALVAAHTSGSVVLYGSRDSFIHYYRLQSNLYRTEYITVEVPETHCATDVRRAIAASAESNPAFRRGMIHSRLNQHDICFCTVDMLITRRGGTEVLLGQKKKDLNKGVWRILGGFFDKGNGSGRRAAARELSEEANLVVDPALLQAVETLEITNDWRYRSTTDTIVTTLYTMEINDLVPVAGDDIKNVGWFSLEEAGKLMAPCHTELWQTFLSYLHPAELSIVEKLRTKYTPTAPLMQKGKDWATS